VAAVAASTPRLTETAPAPERIGDGVVAVSTPTGTDAATDSRTYIPPPLSRLTSPPGVLAVFTDREIPLLKPRRPTRRPEAERECLLCPENAVGDRRPQFVDGDPVKLDRIEGTHGCGASLLPIVRYVRDTMNLALRALWFVTVGWALGVLFFSIGIILMLTVIGFPVGAYLCAKTWAVMTLKTNPATVVVERPETAG
jgi:hypothetical protein